jgi:hypothetical protein
MKRSSIFILFALIFFALYPQDIQSAADMAWPERDSSWKSAFVSALSPVLEKAFVPTRIAAFVMVKVCAGESLEAPAEAAALVGRIATDIDLALRRGQPTQALAFEGRRAYRSEIALARAEPGARADDAHAVKKDLAPGLSRAPGQLKEKVLKEKKDKADKKEKEDKEDKDKEKKDKDKDKKDKG